MRSVGPLAITRPPARLRSKRRTGLLARAGAGVAEICPRIPGQRLSCGGDRDASVLAANASDPGQFTVCLASHGIKLPDSGALTACIQGAHDLSALQACLTKAVR